MIKRICHLMAWLVILSACLPQPTPSLPTATSTLTPEPALQPSVVWFPPTATFTPFPTRIVTPTSVVNTEIGALLYRDDFTDPVLWTTQATTSGNISLVNSELTLAITEPRVFLFSTRQSPPSANFYVEVTANTSLCKGLDEYGLMLRVTPNLDYYRFSLSCDGQVRLDRILGGAARALQTWDFGIGVPPGAPGTVRLAAWLGGEELRLFANDQLQFTIRDPLIPSGTIGVFARAVGNTAVTVSFSDLAVYEVAGGS
jgi:hypothetical protein